MRGRLRQVAASLQAAVRFRHISRRESRPPDWFVDKTNQDEVSENKENRAPTCWGHRIVVNPSLPSHYKVTLSFIYYSNFTLERFSTMQILFSALHQRLKLSRS